MTAFREQAAIAVFVEANRTWKPPAETDGKTATKVLAVTAAQCAQDLADECCNEWGHDFGDFVTCRRCGAEDKP